MKKMQSFLFFLFLSILSGCPATNAGAQDAEGTTTIILKAKDAALKTDAQLKIEEVSGETNLGWWTKTNEEITWKMIVGKDGDYLLSARVACDPQFSGSTVSVTIDSRALSFAVPDTGGWFNYQDAEIGTLRMKVGTYAVTVKARNVKNRFVCNLRSISFTDRPARENENAALSLKDKIVWLMTDVITSQNDLDRALAYAPEVILRGWFKWDKAFDWNNYRWMVRKAHARGAVFGGGGTLSCLYPNEVDETTFQRFVDRNPLNQPEYFMNTPSSNSYHGNIQNTEYLDFILTWIRNQIDAGADTLFLDEVNGATSWRTGYSDSGMAAFNDYLMEKFMRGRAWTGNDQRWKTRLDIDLQKDSRDGSIESFDYRLYLKRKGYGNDPYAHDFPLKQEWGDAWDYKTTDSYLHRRNQESWKYVTTEIRDYLQKTGKQVSIAANGWNDYVDYQIEGVWYRWKVVNGKLDISPSYVNDWRDVLAKSRRHLGKEVPLIVFHDWGFSMPYFDEISDSDRVLWLRAYGAEVFASGAILAWPISNCGNKYRPSPALDGTIRQLMSWYGRNRDMYLNSTWVGNSIVDVKGVAKVVTTVSDVQSDAGNRRIVHLINKNLDTNREFVVQSNFKIAVLSREKPNSVSAVSPDFETSGSLSFSWKNGTAEIEVDRLEAYTVVVLQY